MSKYAPLNTFLKGQLGDQLAMTFADIERVLGAKLPASKSHRAWWSNNPDNNVMTKEWLEAGYETESVDIAGEKLVFRRTHPLEKDMTHGGFGEAQQPEISGSTRPLHPGYGSMKGMIKFAEDFDATESAFPDWQEYEEQKFGAGSKLHE